MTACADPQKYLYVVSDGVEFVKVGISHSIERRVRAISTACPRPLRLVKKWPVPNGSILEAERIAHGLLMHAHSNGEWFSASEEEATQAVERAIRVVSHKEPRPFGLASPPKGGVPRTEGKTELELRVGKLVYERRVQTRQHWSEIVKDLGLTSEEMGGRAKSKYPEDRAYHVAALYAKATNSPWPVPKSP